MAIKESGVKLVVQNLSGFTSGLAKAEGAYQSFISSTAKGAKVQDPFSGLASSADKSLGQTQSRFTSFLGSLGKGAKVSDPFTDLTGNADRSIGTIQAKFGALNSFTAGIFAGLGVTLAQSLISGATTAVGAISKLLQSAFQQGISLEQAGANAFAITQPSKEQQGQLAALAESVALNPNLQVSQAGALEAINAALTANISAQQILGGGLIEAIVSQQNALGGNFEENARLISKQLNDQAGQANALSAQQLADQNVGTFKAGQFRSINDLVLAQASAGGALKNLGVSQQQFNEFLAIAGTTASGGSDAGTSVKAFINASTNASKEQAAAQKQLGFKIADDQGNFNSALELSQQLSAARTEGINTIISSGGGTKEQQAALKKLNSQINSNLNTAQNLEAGISGVNLSDEARAKKIATANTQAQNAKKEFDSLLSTVPGLKQTATKIQASETEFAGLLFQAFGTDAGRFAAALAGLSEEEANRVTAIIEGASALEVAAIKTDTVSAKFEALTDAFNADLVKVSTPSLGPIKSVLASLAGLAGALTPAFTFAGNALANIVTGPLTNISSIIDNLSLGIKNFTSGFSRSISLSDIIQVAPGGLDFGITKDLLTGGNKIFLTFGDIFEFQKDASGFLFDIKDIFKLDTTGTKTELKLGDYVTFTNDVGSTQFTIGDFFTFASNPTATIITLSDYFEFTNDLGKTTFSIGDFFNFSKTIVKTKLTIGDFFTFDTSAANQFTLDIGSLVKITGSQTASGVFRISLNDQNFSLDLGAITSFVQGIPGKISAAITSEAQGISAAFSIAGFEGVAALIGAQISSAVATLSGALSAAKDKLSGLFTSVDPTGVDSAFTLDIPDFAAIIKTQIAGFFTDFKVTIPDIGASIKTQVESFFSAETFTVTIPDFAAGIKTQISGYFADFTIDVPDFVADIKTKISGYLEGLTPEKLIGDSLSVVTDPNIGVGGLVNLIPGLTGTAAALTTLAAINFSSITAGVTAIAAGFTALALPAIGAALTISTIVGSISLLNEIDIASFATLGTTISDAATGILDFGTKLVEGFDAEGFASTASTFVTSFVDRISATISGVDTQAIGASALTFVSSILTTLGNFLGSADAAGIGESAGKFVGSLVDSFTNLLSNPQAFVSLGEGAVGLAGGIASFVTSLVTSFSTELTKIDFGALFTNLALDFSGLALGIGNAISTALVGKIDEILGTQLASPAERFQAFVDGIIAAVNSLPGIGSLITTKAEAAAAEKGITGSQPKTTAATANDKTASYLTDLTSNVVKLSAQTTTIAATGNNPLPGQSVEQTSFDLLGSFVGSVGSFLQGVLPTQTAATSPLGIISVPKLDLSAGSVTVDGTNVTTPNGEPQTTFDPFAALAGQPIQGPLTQAQALAQSNGPVPVTIQNPTAAIQGPLTQAQAAAQNPFSAVATGPIPVTIQNPTSLQTPTTAATSQAVAQAPEAVDINGALQSGAEAFSESLKAAASSVKSAAAAVKIPPFKWPVIKPFDLGSKVPNFRWPDVASVNLANYIPAFPGWATIFPFINIPQIPPFPGWAAFIGPINPPSGGNQDLPQDPQNGVTDPPATGGSIIGTQPATVTNGLSAAEYMTGVAMIVAGLTNVELGISSVNAAITTLAFKLTGNDSTRSSGFDKGYSDQPVQNSNLPLDVIISGSADAIIMNATENATDLILAITKGSRTTSRTTRATVVNVATDSGLTDTLKSLLSSSQVEQTAAKISGNTQNDNNFSLQPFSAGNGLIPFRKSAQSTLLNSNTQQVADAIKDVASVLTSAVPALADATTQQAQNVATGVNLAVQQASQIVSSVGNTVGTITQSITGSVQDFVNGLFGLTQQTQTTEPIVRPTGNRGLQSDIVDRILATPPSITNNYVTNNTRNYNLNVQTMQSESSISDQFAYLERLAASV